MKRADHSMIFIFIAGSYTPFALVALRNDGGWALFWIVWGSALAGVALKMLWPSSPRWLGVPLYILLGWVAAFYIVPIMDHAGVAAMVLLIVGGALYSIGGVLYALGWPNPGRRRSVTTSSSMPAPRSRRSATTSRCGSRCSPPADDDRLLTSRGRSRASPSNVKPASHPSVSVALASPMRTARRGGQPGAVPLAGQSMVTLSWDQ